MKKPLFWSEQWKIIMAARNHAPVPVESLPEKLGISFRKAYLAEGISGMIERLGDSFLITVSAIDPHTRQRFTLAHELGHYIVHRHLIGDGIDDDRAYRSTQAGKYHNTLIGPVEETEANKFAANLLMPADVIDAEWKKQDAKASKKDRISSMAALFQVSEQAMKIRLKAAKV